MPQPTIVDLALDMIRLDGGTQQRDRIHEDTVAEYAEAVDSLPPVVVFHDGADYWLAGGFHRYHAHRKAERDTIRCEVRSGTVRDAVLFAAGDNAEHGLRRTNEDKRKAVSTLLEDPEWGQWSDRQIGRLCRVNHHLVASVREEFAPGASGTSPRCAGEPAPRKAKRGGKTYTQRPRKSKKKVEVPSNGDADSAPADDSEEEPEVGQVPTDEDGTPLPPPAMAAFEGLPTLRKFCRTLDSMGAELEQLGKSPVGTHVHWQSARSQLKAARSTVWQGRPAFVCPLCSGKDPDCKTCRGHGFVTAAIHDQFQPAGRNGGQTA